MTTENENNNENQNNTSGGSNDTPETTNTQAPATSAPATEAPANTTANETPVEGTTEKASTAGSNVKVTFTGAAKKTVEVASGQTLDDAIAAAKIANGKTYRAENGNELDGSTKIIADTKVNVVAKTRMG